MPGNSTYIPLHHKYRPQVFAELVGQEAIATTLTNAIKQQKIAPAYLFTGARGTGKTSSARILAKSLNCLQEKVPTPGPCGVCEVCRTITNGTALDVIEIDAASNTGVDNIRELIERAQFAPVQCRYKVYVLDEVHMLSSSASNALLKTLEEPPDRVVFILATTDPQRVLPTIISRCQRFDFRRIPLVALVEHLQFIATQENISITSDAIHLVAQISQGGLRDAESLLDQLSLLAGQVTAERVWDLVGAVPERDLLSLVIAIAQTNSIAVLDLTRRLMDRGREPLIVLQNLASFYRDLLIAKTAPDRNDLVALTPPTWAQLCEFAHDLEVGQILAAQQHLRTCELQVKQTTQPRLWLEVALLGLLPADPSAHALENHAPVMRTEPKSPLLGYQAPVASMETTAPTSLSKAQEAIPAVTSEVETSEPEPSELAPAAIADESEEATPEPDQTPAPSLPLAVPATQSVVGTNPQFDLSQIWQKVLSHIEQRGTQMLLSQQGCLLSCNGAEACIGITQQWHKTTQERLSWLETAFQKVFARPVRVTLKIIAPSELKAPGTQNPATPHPTTPSPGFEVSAPHLRESPASQPAPTRTPPVKLPAESSTSVNGSASEHQGYNPESSLAPQPFVADPLLPQGGFWQEEDEVTKAAKRLAEFFGGKVISLEDDLDTPEVSTSDSLPIDTWDDANADPSSYPDDVPF